jgi:Arc/MetJ family transcription regulator
LRYGKKFDIPILGYLTGGTSMYVKKTIEIDNQMIKKSKKILNVSTDKEAVNQALRLICEEDEIIKTHEKLAGNLEIVDMFR